MVTIWYSHHAYVACDDGALKCCGALCWGESSPPATSAVEEADAQKAYTAAGSECPTWAKYWLAACNTLRCPRSHRLRRPLVKWPGAWRRSHGGQLHERRGKRSTQEKGQDERRDTWAAPYVQN